MTPTSAGFLEKQKLRETNRQLETSVEADSSSSALKKQFGSTLRANIMQKLQVSVEASEPSTKAGESSKKSTVRSLVIQSKSSVPSKSNSSKQLLPD